MADRQNDALQNASIKILVDDYDIGISPMSMSFVIRDSIYDFFPTCKITFTDNGGVMNDALAFVNGTKVKLWFGSDESTWKSCEYVVDENCVPERLTSANFGGYLETFLVHNFYAKQNKINKIYPNSNISNIIEEISNKYKFLSKDILFTNNIGMWIQPYVTDAEFIMNQLLPLSYSTSSKNSPFYCFINSNNEFVFNNFNSLMNRNSIEELTYTNSPYNMLLDNIIIDINFLQPSLHETKSNYNRLLYAFDKNGTYSDLSENNLITQFPKQSKYLPIKADLNLITDTENLFDYDTNDEDIENNNMGLKTNSIKNSLLMDKIIIMTNLNRNFTSGKTIDIKLPSSQNQENGDYSLRYSGKYLIESSYHIWTGKNCFTKLVCGKQSVKLTNDYRNKNFIVNS